MASNDFRVILLCSTNLTHLLGNNKQPAVVLWSVVFEEEVV